MSESNAGAPAPPPVVGLLAEFEAPEQLLDAARKVRDAGYTRWDAHTPYPLHGLEKAMGLRRTRLPWIVFAAGLAGLAGAFALQGYVHAVDYPLNMSGKPFLTLPEYLPVMFELTVLVSGITAFAGALALSRLPQYHHPFFAHPRFKRATSDRFFISLEVSDPRFERQAAEALLRAAGSASVEVVEDRGGTGKLPRWLVFATVLLAAVSLVPLMLIAQRRATPSDRPHPRLFTEMVFQPKYITQDATPFFADRRSSRPHVPGTIAQGELEADDALYRGKSGDQFVTRIPLPVTMALMRRGQERFDIYCATCHGYAGLGDGMTAKRADALQEGTWTPPTSLHTDPVRQQPVGQIFNTITYGIRKMPPYSPLIPVQDRWAIILYVRALERSQNARAEDVPPEVRPSLK